MAHEWIYLLKVNAGIILFYAFYKLCCQHDTFFRWRRFLLLGLLFVSLLHPLFDVRNWVTEQPVMADLADYYTSWMAEEYAASATAVAEPPEAPSALQVIEFVYWLGVALLAARFLIRLLSIFRLRRMGTRVRMDNGVNVISLPFASNPFSFFGWIFIHLPTLDAESRDDILLHEQTHATQLHSIDVVLMELFTVACWFNPFVWLLNGEVRLNLEYLADRKVTQQTEDCRPYQYHLLGLAHPNPQKGLTNSFNVSHIKRRIMMMNKKRTSASSRIKYALFAPLAGLLMLVSNVEIVARNAYEVAQDVLQQQDKVKQVADEMPSFPGGMMECMKFLAKNIMYPPQAIQQGIQGRVILRFIVGEDGTVSDIRVVKGVDPSLDAEAIRVAEKMPKWIPGKNEGKPVRVYYTLPVIFRMSQEAPSAKSAGEKAPAESKPDKNGVYTVCDEMPTFPGGMAECMRFLGKVMEYPVEAMKRKEQGRVIVQFVIQPDGTITDAHVRKGVSPLIDAEALRVVSVMPAWTPGKQNGEAVPCRYTLPITFRLQ